jgi:hypothetical protein
VQVVISIMFLTEQLKNRYFLIKIQNADLFLA